jgi:ABC-type multidrug transport system fused ATPase/permease subunit
MERGYQTRLGDGGNTLSGGQKQRLSIARAVLKNADVLILDEATSALDTVSEKYIQQAIDELSKDKIIISIAHRLSSIKHFPNIVVLNGGELVEKGTHQELIELNGLYASLCSMQQMKSEA